MENLAKQANGDLNPSLKLAIAMAIVESRGRKKLSSPSATTDAACNGDSQALCGNTSESDAIKWKRKAKQRKEEIIRLKEDLKIAEDGLHHDIYPQNVSCKCYFFDNLGQLSPKDESDQKRFGDVLRRRFFRQELVHSHYDFQFHVQHLMRKLGSDPYVGQRVILSVSQRIYIVAESLLVMDPFDGAFPKMHIGMYLMIQLIEFLISDYLLSWSTMQDFDAKLLEEWVVSVFSARKALELMESRNTLYVLYMDRIVGALTRHLGQVSLKNKLRPATLEKLFG